MKKIVTIAVSTALITCIGYFFYNFTIMRAPASNVKAVSTQQPQNEKNTGHDLSAVSNNSMQAPNPVGGVQKNDTVTAVANSNAAENSQENLKQSDKVQGESPKIAANDIKQFDIKNYKYVQIKGSGVNVRSESHIAANNSIGKVAKGDIFEVLGAEQPTNDKLKWIKIKLKDGKAGFVREDLVELRASKNAK